MARRIYRYPAPDSFVAGVVGTPGQRTFYLQAWHDGAPVTVVLEKVQLAVLAERLLALVGEMRRRGLSIAAAPETEPAPTFQEPDAASPAFRVGTLSLTWDGEHPAVTIEAQALDEDEDAP